MLSKKHNIKSAKLAARRRKKLIGTVVFSFLAVAGVWGLVFLFFGWSHFNISKINVIGLNYVKQEEVLAEVSPFFEGKYFYTVPKTSIFVYSKEKIKNHLLEKFSEIRDVEISLSSVNDLNLSFSEREPQSVWCDNNLGLSVSHLKSERCYYVDDVGLVYRKISESEVASTTGNYVKLSTFKSIDNPIKSTFSDSGFYILLFKFIKDLSLIDQSVASVYERDDLTYEVKLSTGQKLVIGKNDDLGKVFNNFQVVMSNTDFKDVGGFSKLDYIDLRFGNKVYYKGK